MEEERLARKRKASTSPPHPSKSQKVRTSAPLVPAPKKDKGLEYLQGTVRKTWAFGHDRGLGHEEIRLEEVLRKDDLRLAVLSSFQWDIGWLLSKVNMRNTQVTLVMQAEDEATKQQYAQETADMPNLRLCFPTMEGQINCMHSKLMLLSYANHLRIVVPTANLVPYDWGETGDMENMLFLIDLPRLAEGRRSESLTHFGKELFWFLQAQGLEQSIISSLHNFDFAGTEDLAFVHTIGGAHLEKDGDWARTGYCGLGRAVKKLGLSTGVPLSIDFVASSIGAVNLDFMATLYLAAHGDDGRTEYEWRNPPKGKAKKSKVDGPGTKEQDIKAEIVRNFRIYFPTYETVRKSIAGSAGTICFQSKWYNSATFPRRVMRECKSARSGLLMHNKVGTLLGLDQRNPSILLVPDLLNL